MPFKNPHPLYTVWQAMKQRCCNPCCHQWADYGGRGITVCERWQRSFQDFIADMGPRPEGALIDRIDNSGNYEPGNCEWVSKSQSQMNRRNTKFVTIAGRCYKAADLAKLAMQKPDTIALRAEQGLNYVQVTAPTRRRSNGGLAAARKAAMTRRKRTHCKRGHEYNAENTFTRIAKGHRICRLCTNIRRQGRQK